MSDTAGFSARFDSLDPRRGGRSFRFRDLRKTLAAWRVDEVIPTLRELEGAVSGGLHATGWVAYEAAPAFDPALVAHSPYPGLPLVWFALWERRESVAPLQPVPPPEQKFSLGPWSAALSEAEYRARVERIRARIAAGETYQANLTFLLHAPFQGDGAALYRQIAQAQRSAFCAYLHTPRWSVASASPELFFHWNGTELELRPMKGTRPRGRWSGEDRALAADLCASPKDRAENLMIVDLLRNDAGRVAEWGSVRVPSLFEVERYPTVHQMTSTIRARTRAGTTLVDLFRALFPCGSVTGAPKVRTTAILRALEDGPRGVYTGAVGFVSPGETVFSVAIRTVVIDRERGSAELGVGSGITWDSDPGDEFRECVSKAAFTRTPPVDFEILESLLYRRPGGWTLLDAHLRRMAGSAARWEFPWDPATARSALARAVGGLGDGAHKMRLRLARDGAFRADSSPLPDPDASPLRVAVCADPVDSGNPLLYHKTTARTVYTSRAALHPECDEVILVNERGEVTEFATGNLVARLEGRLWTPPLRAGLLPGVLREALLRTGEVSERPLWPEDLRRADSVWIVNSVRGPRRVILAPPEAGSP